jgi:hypothetical protein
MATAEPHDPGVVLLLSLAPQVMVEVRMVFFRRPTGLDRQEGGISAHQLVQPVRAEGFKAEIGKGDGDGQGNDLIVAIEGGSRRCRYVLPGTQ